MEIILIKAASLLIQSRMSHSTPVQYQAVI